MEEKHRYKTNDHCCELGRFMAHSLLLSSVLMSHTISAPIRTKW